MKQKVNNAKEFISANAVWKKELKMLDKLMQKTEMEETIKWGIPVFCIDGKNVAGYAAFKNWVTIWFYQGVFLKDKNKKLINAQEGKTQAMRHWRFENLEAIKKDEKIIVAYLEESIKNCKAGKQVKVVRKKIMVPPELQAALTKSKTLQKKFDALSHGNRRGYADYIAEAKRAETKKRRLEKIIPMIKEGVGLVDKYKPSK